VKAASSDVASVSVYGSISSSDPNKTVILLINRATSQKRVGVTLRHSTVYRTAQVWTLSGTRAEPTSGGCSRAVATNAFNDSMPALSVAALVPAP
jgi:hypothetical protein